MKTRKQRRLQIGNLPATLAPLMPQNPETCPNCHGPVRQDENYCPACGQKNHIPRLTLREIGIEVFLAFTDARGIPQLIVALLKQPGLVAREYVWGKRKRHFPPVSFLILVVGISAFLIGETHMITQIQTGSAQRISRFMETHVNLILFLNIPVVAFYNHWLFAKKGFNLAEHLVLVTYFSGMKSLIFITVVIPTLYFFPELRFVVTTFYLLVGLAYFSWANTQFVGDRRPGTWAKGLLSPLLAFLSILLLVTGTMAVYLAVFGKEVLR